MSLETIKQIREFVVENFLFGLDNGDLSNDGSLLEEGIIDSTGIFEIIDFLEKNFKIKVEDDDLVRENMDSIQRIAGFVSRKLGIEDTE